MVNPPVVCPSEGKPLEEKRGESNNNKSNTKESKKKCIASSVRKNRFNNFPQREYDFDQLEKDLLAEQIARWKASETEDADVCVGQEKQTDGVADAEITVDVF